MKRVIAVALLLTGCAANDRSYAFEMDYPVDAASYHSVVRLT
jgi:hypothetical protein